MNTTVRKYAVHGDTVFPYKEQEGTQVNKVPVAVYKVRESLAGYYLLRTSDSIELPSKIYGSTRSRSERTYQYFDKTKSSVTVGLFGAKGAGKTLLANYMANEALSRGMPVIDVSDSFSANSHYLSFLESLGEIFILFDEFLKVLSKGIDKDGNSTRSSNNCDSAQDTMLTFLQGTNNTRRFTVLIDNDSRYLSDYISNRPGRMRYIYRYECIEAAVAEALAIDAKIPTNKIEQLVTYSQKYQATFDQMNAIITEWSDYPNETLEQITEVLNVATVRPVVEEKGIVSYKGELPEDIRIAQGTSCKISGLSVYINVQRKNKYFNTPVVTEKEFSDRDMDCDFESYKQYVESINKEWIDSVIGLGRDSIKSMFNSFIAYNYCDAVIEVQVLEKEITNQYSSYFNTQAYYDYA